MNIAVIVLVLTVIIISLFSCYRSEREHFYYFMKRYCSYFNMPIPSFRFYFWCCWFSSPSFCERYLKKYPHERDLLALFRSYDRDKNFKEGSK